MSPKPSESSTALYVRCVLYSDVPEAAYHAQQFGIRLDVVEGLKQRDIVGGHLGESLAEIRLGSRRLLEEPQAFPRRTLLGETVALYLGLGPHRPAARRLDVLNHNISIHFPRSPFCYSFQHKPGRVTPTRRLIVIPTEVSTQAVLPPACHSDRSPDVRKDEVEESCY